jgi:hypothetical protein
MRWVRRRRGSDIPRLSGLSIGQRPRNEGDFCCRVSVLYAANDAPGGFLTPFPATRSDGLAEDRSTNGLCGGCRGARRPRLPAFSREAKHSLDFGSALGPIGHAYARAQPNAGSRGRRRWGV